MTGHSSAIIKGATATSATFAVSRSDHEWILLETSWDLIQECCRGRLESFIWVVHAGR